MIFFDKDRAPKWFSQILSCISLRTYSASAGVRHLRLGREKPLLYNIHLIACKLDCLTISILSSNSVDEVVLASWFAAVFCS